MSVDAAPPLTPAPPAPQTSGREPVLAAVLALFVLVGGLAAAVFIGWRSLEVGDGGVVASRTGVAPTNNVADEPASAVAFIDSLDLEVEGDSPPFTLVATAHVGSNPGVLPDSEVRVYADLIAPDGEEQKIEGVADERGNVVMEAEVGDPGIYTVSVVDVQGEGITYDSTLNDDYLASVRAGDDEGPEVVERTEEDADVEASDPVDTHTSSGEIDSGIVEADGDSEPDAEPTPFDVDDLFDDGGEPEPTGTPFEPPIIDPFD